MVNKVLNGIPEAAKEISLYKIKIISVITQIEVLAGAQSSDEEDIIRRFLSTFQIQPLTEAIAEETISLRKEQRLKIPDAIVYAMAKKEESLLISRNTKDFKNDWSDLRVPYQL